MELTIKIKDKIIKDAINNRLDYTYDDFYADVIKAAGVPTKAQLAKSLFTDDGFRKQLTKDVTAAVNELFRDGVVNIEYKDIDDVYDRLNDVYEKKLRAEVEARKATSVELAIKNATDILTKAGYKVTK